MKTTSTFLILLLSLTFLSCSEGKKQAEAPAEDSPTEMASMDAEVLFDGSSLDAWRNFKTDTLSHLWKIEDGTLTLSGKGGGDIVTRNSYESFELDLEWKISPNGNSGIFFHVSEADTLEKCITQVPKFKFWIMVGIRMERFLCIGQGITTICKPAPKKR